jgi:choline dehydrogenase-like flavoprotein
MQILERGKTWDVCIVGSGAGGGMAAKVLCESGAECVLLEAGPWWAADRDGAMLTWNYASPRRGGPTRSKPFGEFDGCLGGWELEGEPYTVADGENFLWWRARMLGGRTNHWGRISLRFGPWDFKGRSRDGLGDDWPIGYEDLRPYYDDLDRLVGLFGTNEGLPNDPDGIFQPPPPPRAHEHLVKRACAGLGIPCIPARLSVLTRELNGRPACHYCGQCGRGCATRSNFSSPSVLLPPALDTGRLEIRTGAMAREVLTDRSGLASGVSYVDTSTGREQVVRARIVVLAASACETARLLLNSKSPRHPNGLANSSGCVGRYLTDTTGVSLAGQVPALESLPPYNDDGTGGMHVYVPGWLYGRKLDFARAYHIEPSGGREMPGLGILWGIESIQGGGYGRKLKADYRRLYGSIVSFDARGEMIPSADCYCELDPETVDRFGIPVLRFHWKWSEHEIQQARHMQQTMAGIVEAMGGKVMGALPGRERDYGLEAGGEIIHEAGTTRMGSDPKTSVLNAWCQAHDCKNLFVADSGPFVSNAHKNMTWTILALAMRTSRHISEERRKGNLP